MSSFLKRESKGAAVREIQRRLNLAQVKPTLSEDGTFGRATELAVRDLQGRLGLVVDGMVGPQTRTALHRLNETSRAGRTEPDKSAMSEPAPKDDGGGPLAVGAVPPNVSALQLLKTARPIEELIWHCAATPAGKDFTVADIRAWHKARGWSDIGYHYVVYRDGRIVAGRPIGQVGSHVAGRNTGTVGCCYVGGLSADGKVAQDTRTPAQAASMIWLTRRLVDLHGIGRVSGHNQYAAKACPSFDVRADALGSIAG